MTFEVDNPFGDGGSIKNIIYVIETLGKISAL